MYRCATWVLHWLTHMQFSCQLVQLPMLAWILPMQNSCQLQTGTLVATHARLVPTCVAARVGTNVAPCKTHANFGRVSCWHECCYMQKLCQMLDRGRGLTHGDNSSSHWHTKKVKIRNNYSCFNNCKSLISLVVATTATTMEK